MAEPKTWVGFTLNPNESCTEWVSDPSEASLSLRITYKPGTKYPWGASITFEAGVAGKHGLCIHALECHTEKAACQHVISQLTELDKVIHQLIPTQSPGKQRSKDPTLTELIQIVMGDEVLNSQQVAERLQRYRWTPNSKDPIGYIRFILSSTPWIFIRGEGLGCFRLQANNPYCRAPEENILAYERNQGKPKMSAIQ